MGKEYKLTLNKIVTHFVNIMAHKYFVFRYCSMTGFAIMGLLHDMSKFSFKEFWINARYVEDNISPIAVQRRVVGYSDAWFHHKGHNPHHYEYWVDKFDDGCYVTRMPFKYTVECLCDYLAANKVYNGPEANFSNEYKWWKKNRKKIAMHPDNKKFLSISFAVLARIENKYHHKELEIRDYLTRRFNDPRDVLNRVYLQELYLSILDTSPYPDQIKLSEVLKITD